MNFESYCKGYERFLECFGFSDSYVKEEMKIRYINIIKECKENDKLQEQYPLGTKDNVMDR